MRKSILKTGAALMAAVMMMASPITAKAEGVRRPTIELPEYLPKEAVDGIAYEIGEYRIPSIGRTDGGYVSSDLVMQLRQAGNPDESYDSWLLEWEIECPAGYEVRPTVISLNSGTSWWWDVEGDNTKNWEEIKSQDINYTGCGMVAYSFSVNYNNTVYPDCKFVMTNEFGEWVTIELIVPQGYNDDILYTIYGGKVENGERVQDKSSQLRFLLCGNGAGAGQSAPAATSQPAPETVEQQPVIETTSQPAPETIEQQPVPETISQPTPATSYQGTVYVTKAGDNLAKIAKEVYGDRNLWKDIYELNKELIKNPRVIYANMQLILP